MVAATCYRQAMKDERYPHWLMAVPYFLRIKMCLWNSFWVEEKNTLHFSEIF